MLPPVVDRGVLQVEWCEYQPSDGLAEVLPGDRLDRRADEVEPVARVGVLRSRFEQQRVPGEDTKRVGDGHVVDAAQCLAALVVPDAGDVCQELAGGHRMTLRRKRGDVALYRRVEIEPLLLREPRGSGSGECL